MSWEQEAENWIRWARTPGHDAYWRYREAFFALVPPAGRATLEVGCGEGRVARDLAARGHHVTGIDSSPTLLRAAREADPGGRYELADAAALPFADDSFDLVVAYNSLMDVDDMPAPRSREAARVLAAGGALCACVTHPLADAGSFASRDTDAPFVIEGAYFGQRRFEGTLRARRARMTFHGWCLSARGLHARARGGGPADRDAARAGRDARTRRALVAAADVPHVARRVSATR